MRFWQHDDDVWHFLEYFVTMSLYSNYFSFDTKETVN